MKKIYLLAAGVMLTASVVAAQTGNGSDATGTATATISGIFTPGAGIVVPGTSLTLPASTPVTVSSPGGTVGGVMAGTPASVATFTASLQSSGIPSATATAIANALGQLSGGTAGAVAGAVNAFNAAAGSMTHAQRVSLMRSPEGRAAFRAMRNATAAFRAAR